MRLDVNAVKSAMIRSTPALEDLAMAAEFRVTRAESECKTAYVTMVAKDTPLVVFNEKWMETLPFDQQAAVCKHEFLHVVFGHMHSHLGVEQYAFNVMADVLINRHIENLPDCALTDRNIAQHIFGQLLTIGKKGQELFEPLLAKLRAKNYLRYGPWPAVLSPAHDLHLSQLIDYFHICVDFLRRDLGVEPPILVTLDDSPPADGMVDSISEEMLESILKKAQHSPRGYGTGTPYAFIRDLQTTLNYRRAVPWPEALKDALSESASGKIGQVPSWRKPSRRFGSLSSGVKSLGVDIVVVVDTSGSVDPSRVNEVAEELTGLMDSGFITGAFPVIYGDIDVGGYQMFSGSIQWEAVRGGGGTDMNPLIAHAIKAFGTECTVLVFTDGEIPPYKEYVGINPSKLVWLVCNHYGDRWKEFMKDQPGRVIDVSIGRK